MTEHFAKAWGISSSWTKDKSPHPHETDTLLLDCSKARRKLGWHPVLDAEQTLEWTAAWYRREGEGGDPIDLCLDQIRAYTHFFQE